LHRTLNCRACRNAADGAEGIGGGHAKRRVHALHQACCERTRQCATQHAFEGQVVVEQAAGQGGGGTHDGGADDQAGGGQGDGPGGCGGQAHGGRHGWAQGACTDPGHGGDDDELGDRLEPVGALVDVGVAGGPTDGEVKAHRLGLVQVGWVVQVDADQIAVAHALPIARCRPRAVGKAHAAGDAAPGFVGAVVGAAGTVVFSEGLVRQAGLLDIPSGEGVGVEDAFEDGCD
jgi:hypothetical protein